MKINFFLSILFFSLVTAQVLAKPRCEILYDVIYNDPIREDVNIMSSENIKDIGIRLEKKWEEYTKITDPRFPKYLGAQTLKTNRDGYYSVGKITNRGLSKQIKVGDVILSINGIDLRKVQNKLNTLKKEKKIEKVPNINRLLLNNVSDLFDDGEIIYYELLRKNDKTNKLEKIKVSNYFPDFKYTDQLEKIKNEMISIDTPEADVFVTAINIDEKNGTFDASIDTTFLERLDERYFLTKAIWQNIVYDKKFTDNKLDAYMFETCTFPDERYEKLNSVDPVYGIKFENLVQEYKHLRNSYYSVAPVTEELNKPYFLQKKSIVKHVSSSVYKINNDFNLRAFPFDKQKLSIYLRAYLPNQDLSSFHSNISHRTIKRAWEFRDSNSIQGWNIKNISSKYSVYEDSIDLNHYDGFILEFNIERKSGYYVSKIILPILLILMICWSAVWIDPKEIESRLTITIVCLLSLIAYNFVIDSDLPKLEYLTIMDYIILISYVYAAIPNFLSIYSFGLIKKNKALVEKYEFYEKRYGLPSYLLIIFLIIITNASSAPEHTNSIFSWAAMK